MDKTIQLLPDGTLTVTESIPDGYRTTRYFDSRRQMLLTVVDKTSDKTIITKYEPNGHFIQSITVEQKNKVSVYQKDGKTLVKEREVLPDGSEHENLYQSDGKTLKRVTHYHMGGSVYTTVYQSDGKTLAQIIEQDDVGLSKTVVYDADGKQIVKKIEDLSDGAIRITVYKPHTDKIAYVQTGPLKGETHPNTYQRDEYDENGKTVHTEKIVIP